VHDPTRAHPHETTDHDQRPVRLPSPSGNAFNQVADAGAVAAQGPVGSMAGLPVYLDPNIAINTGTGSNQDSVLVMKADDLYLWETSITMRDDRLTLPGLDCRHQRHRSRHPDVLSCNGFPGASKPVSRSLWRRPADSQGQASQGRIAKSAAQLPCAPGTASVRRTSAHAEIR
jgi:hypothetical protein